MSNRGNYHNNFVNPKIWKSSDGYNDNQNNLDLMAQKANLDFEFPIDLFKQTELSPNDRYLQVANYFNDAVDSLIDVSTNHEIVTNPWLLEYLIDRIPLSKSWNKDAAYDSASYWANRYGYKNIIQKLKDQGHLHLQAALNGAARGGYIDEVKNLTEFYKGRVGDFDANSYIKQLNGYLNQALYRAGAGGYVNIVKYLIDNGADNYNNAINGAEDEGKLNVIQYLVEINVLNPDRANRIVANMKKL